MNDSILWQNSMKIVKLLLNYGAKSHVLDEDNIEPWELLDKKYQTEFSELVEESKRLNDPLLVKYDIEGLVVMKADDEVSEKIKIKFEKFMKKFLEQNDINKPVTGTGSGQPLLHSACNARQWRKNVKMIKLLFQSGADPQVKNKDGKTPRDLLKTEEHKKEFDGLVKKYWKGKVEAPISKLKDALSVLTYTLKKLSTSLKKGKEKYPDPKLFPEFKGHS